MADKTGVLLVNLGTPDSPAVADVRKYLREFLMDKRVIDIPFISRWLLVNLIIAPFRAPKSAAEYNKLWEERGSPLRFYGEDLRELVQAELGKDYKVVLGMRYQNPGIQLALSKLRKENVSEIIVIPLFPQYASATSGSVADKVMEVTSKWQVIPTIKFINNFVQDKLFIDTWEQIGKKYLQEDTYDTFVFSYHGLPERQILKASVDNYCQLGNCCKNYNQKNRYCYRAQCFLTTRLIAKRLGLSNENCITSFQSRLGKDPWIKPYTEELVAQLADDGKKKVLAFSPAFVADCLETTVEVGETYKQQFLEAGGEKWQLVESLNVHPTWVECLSEIARREKS